MSKQDYLGKDWGVIFGFDGDLEDLEDLISWSEGGDWWDIKEERPGREGSYIAERWINGKYLRDFVKLLLRDEGVTDLIYIYNLDHITENYEDWDEVREFLDL